MLLCINKGFPNHFPISQTMASHLLNYQDRQAKLQTWRSQGWHMDQQEAVCFRPAGDPTNTGNCEPCLTSSGFSLLRFLVAFDSCRKRV